MPEEDAFFLPFGSDSNSPSDGLPDGLRRAGRQAYRRGWRAYSGAGCPFGTEDEAMLIWFAFNYDREVPFTVEQN